MSKCKCSYFHCNACGVECKQRCPGKSHVSRRIPVYWLNTEMTKVDASLLDIDLFCDEYAQRFVMGVSLRYSFT